MVPALIWRSEEEIHVARGWNCTGVSGVFSLEAVLWPAGEFPLQC